MAVIDVQVHAYERNHPGRPWMGQLHGPASATGEEMVTAMDAVGVDGAIIVPTFNLYRYDPSYALAVYARYPERFRVVKPIDPADPGVDDVVADRAKTKGAVGVRLMLRDEQISDPTDPRLNRAFAAAGRHGVPVNFLCWGRLDDGTEVVRRNPDTVIVIDHLGLVQPNEPPPLAEPWVDLPKLLALAAYARAQIPEVALQVLGVHHHRHPVDPRACLPPLPPERPFERLDIHVMQQGGEPGPDGRAGRRGSCPAAWCRSCG